jgi:hypothetical protein
MLSPDDVCKKVEDDLTVYVNTRIANNVKMLYRGETLSISMESDAELQWAEKALSEYDVSIASFQTCCEHKCNIDCENDDSGSWTVSWNGLKGWSNCEHSQGVCDCVEQRYVVAIKLKKK